MAEDNQGTWLSPATFEHLQAELEEMTTVKRAEIAQKIEAARSEGDLRENGGYQAAREEQSKMEGRIIELTHLLENAHVSAPTSTDTVVPGNVITAKIAGDEERFLIGSREQSDLVDVEVYPENAPLGQAIIGLKAGDKTKFQAPNGRKIPVEIVKIESLDH
ncbi:MAG: transcription elongation factor GreA [Ancrocorticia sp.]|uniref:transcription elongation factor GreA n=1 Tax=Ancrocorticia sp. TaxID=2593684 RepID=UPI003F8FBB20